MRDKAAGSMETRRPWEYSAHSFDRDHRHGVAPIVVGGAQIADAMNPGMNMHETFAAGIG